jgi:hypothetical protein
MGELFILLSLSGILVSFFILKLSVAAALTSHFTSYILQMSLSGWLSQLPMSLSEHFYILTPHRLTVQTRMRYRGN